MSAERAHVGGTGSTGDGGAIYAPRMVDPGTDFDEVVAHELELLEPRVRDDPETVRALLHPEFTEFGASGAVWDRDTITTATGSDSSERITATELRPARIDSDTILLTYTAHRGEVKTIRSSVWLRQGDDWRLRHHQGTPCPPEATA
ncbi:hypothetical protein SAMN04487820_106294 [Actinopolyspora mzabensis]|uniref:DUF4440 domain-containing protein n=1 Tax=Actinopolyspora mzabensis TaxID=995066 RepID=A0A1G9AYU9_ACTMZ|nr:nuclear transport factor 2 family protein [Actinopolyspora mzabensis]SDK31765.1 hypothetical protein SAMN04487820_106294 [Actinopolyspora mzabensis]